MECNGVVLNHEWPRMGCKGVFLNHEWPRMGGNGVVLNHEWTRMGCKRVVRTTNGHEWDARGWFEPRMATNGMQEGGLNHGWTRMTPERLRFAQPQPRFSWMTRALDLVSPGRLLFDDEHEGEQVCAASLAGRVARGPRDRQPRVGLRNLFHRQPCSSSNSSLPGETRSSARVIHEKRGCG
jgi:hypothetical protein